MRLNFKIFLVASVALLAMANQARGQDALYRCESASGISIQSAPCPKGVSQRRIPVLRLPAAAATPEPSAMPDQTSLPAPAAMPVAATSPADGPTPVTGPYDPYPLWQCMRADGSTYDSRDGVTGKQWVVDVAAGAVADAAPQATPAQIQVKPKLHDHIVRPYSGPTVSQESQTADANTDPPPQGAAAGKWVADECVQLTPQQACARFATRRDALRKQIYAATPTDRAQFAPEEQDLSSMLYAKCRR